MTSLLTAVGTEIAALGRLALSTPLQPLLSRESIDPAGQHPRPVVLIHGLLGNSTNFLSLRSHLAERGVGHFVNFSYLPRLDFQRLAPQLRETIETVCQRTGATQVDVVGHSLGGVVGRYLLEIGDGHRIRRLVTLGSPYCASRIPDRELAIFGSHDVVAPPPPAAYAPANRIRVVPECGHCGLLYEERAHRTVGRFLTAPIPSAAREHRRLILEAA
jgi:alpha-beta hydrolase superfamily lysophospholipase